MTKKQQPRRMSRAEADALVADIEPARRIAIIVDFMTKLRAAGIACSIVRDATGRTFLALDVDQVRRQVPGPLGEELAALLQEGVATSPQPIWEKSRKARTA